MMEGVAKSKATTANITLRRKQSKNNIFSWYVYIFFILHTASKVAIIIITTTNTTYIRKQAEGKEHSLLARFSTGMDINSRKKYHSVTVKTFSTLFVKCC